MLTRGKWTLPAGFLENGESVREGAMRETYEEARLRVKIIAPYRLFDLVFVNQLYLMFRARILVPDPRYKPRCHLPRTLPAIRALCGRGGAGREPPPPDVAA